MNLMDPHDLILDDGALDVMCAQERGLLGSLFV